MKYILVLCLALLTGCAIKRDNITINYEPMSEVKKISQSVPVAVEVTDIRDEKSKVGCKKNGYGMELARIVNTVDVNELVREAICTELTNRGVTISSRHESSILVDVELGKFYNDFKVGFWAGDAISEVILNVKVKKANGNFSFSKVILGKGVESNILLMDGRNAKSALEAALKDAITRLFSEREFFEAISARDSHL